MTALVIRPMGAEDVPAVAGLEKQCFSLPWSEASLRAELENPLSLWLVAEREGEIAGYVGAQTVLDEADMMNLAVAPPARRPGVAQALLTALLQQLDARGARSLTLEVRAGNLAAQALYRRFGFAAVGRRPDYYRLPREDALILKRVWKETPEHEHPGH